MRALACLLLLSLACGAWGEGEQKPAIAPPEPKRPSPAGKPFVVTRLIYGQVQTRVSALPELVKYFAKATTVRTPVAANALTLADGRLAETALLYMSEGNPEDQLTALERKALGEFLRRGGLLFAEEQLGGTPGTPFGQMVRALVRDPQVLGAAAGSWQPVPNDHPLYSSYFSFPGGPPLLTASSGGVSPLEMIQQRGRVAVILSQLGLGRFWEDPQAESRELGLRLGANLIVFAMAQRTAGGLGPPTAP